MGVAFGSHNTKPKSVTQMLLGLGPGYLVHILAKRGLSFPLEAQKVFGY